MRIPGSMARWRRLRTHTAIAAAMVLCVPLVSAQDSGSTSSAPSPALGVTALKFLRNGDVENALETLGEAADRPTSMFSSDDEGLAAAAGGLHRVLTQLDEEEQFNLLYKWSMPTGARTSIRILTQQVPLSAPPKGFARVLGERPRDTAFPIASIAGIRGLFSTGWSLVRSADDIGRLRRLTTELEQLAADHVVGADVLLLLAQLANSRVDTAALKVSLEQRLDAMRNTMHNADNPASTEGRVESANASNVVLAAAALTHEDLQPISAELFGLLVESTYDGAVFRSRSFLRIAQATAVQINVGESGAEVIRRNRLKYWVPASGRTSETGALGSVDATWLVHEDHILHLAGSQNDVLFLRYPLMGDFEFRCEAQAGGRIGTDGGLVYGGLQFQALGTTSQLTVWDADMDRSKRKPCPFVRHEKRPIFNRMSIRSKDDQAILTTNLHPMWFDDSSDSLASPWLGLRSFGERRPMFRNLAITGNPTIPREVRLSAGHSLRGWQSRFYGESQTAFNENSEETPSPESVDWSFKSGVITAVKQTDLTAADTEVSEANPQSRLHYQRPLLDGESIRYEYWYEPGEFAVHPTLGRLAFLIEPGGVRVHWMTDGAHEWTGLPADNTVLEPLSRRGPRALPLQEKQWNTITMRRADGKVILSIGDAVIYQRAIDFGGDLTFGFYRDRTKSTAKIRNIIMQGDWPETLPADLIANPATVVEAI